MTPEHGRRASEQRPTPPSQGIPPQKTPSWIRWPLRVLTYPFMWLDLHIQRLITTLSPPPYKVEGECLQRGNCCHYILMGWPPVMDKIPLLGRFWLWWYTEIHGFYLRGFDVENVDGAVARVMSCRHLREDGRCEHYHLRPAICRQWPRIEPNTLPYLLKGCGYSVSIPTERQQKLKELERQLTSSHKDPPPPPP